MVIVKTKKPRFKKISLRAKIEDAFKILEDCRLCERRCGCNRLEGQLGYCRADGRLSVSAHYVGDNDLDRFTPCYDIFFLGCVLKCVFCHNPGTSHAREPRICISEKRLARIIDSRSTIKLIDFVGGDPLPQLPFALKIMNYLKNDVPVMWNSSFYMTEESMNFLSGVIDIYSPDIKYGNDECAKRLSDVKNYTSIVHRNIDIAANDSGSELIIRHLVLPNHLECCSTPIIDYISKRFGDNVRVHLMGEYMPHWRSKEYPDINRTLKKKEFDSIVKYANEIGLNVVTS